MQGNVCGLRHERCVDRVDYETGFSDQNVQTSLGSVSFRHHAGTGKRLVFLHGFAANNRVWKRLAEKLPEDLDVYLVDMLGHGNSSAPEIIYAIDRQVEALHDLVRELGIEDCYIIGHSYGGWAVARYAVLGHPTSGIVLEDAGGLKEEIDAINEGEGAQAFEERMYRQAMRYSGNREHVIRSILRAEFGDTVLDYESLSRIECPALIVWGDKDNFFDVRFAHLFARGIPDSKTLVIAGAGHEPHYTHPDAFGGALLQFIGHH